MVTLTKLEKFRKEEKAQAFKPLLDELTLCSEPEFVQKLTQTIEWERSRDDLYIWIPVLNRIDDILNRMLDRYSYKSSNRKTEPTKLIMMDLSDEKVTKELLWFTCRLLYNTSNRSLYSSLDVMANLLNCPNYIVKLGALKVAAIVGEIDRRNLLSDEEFKRKALDLALALPSSTADDQMDHFALSDLFFDKKSYPSKWSHLNFSYYSTVSKAHPSSNKAGSVKKFSLTAEELSSLSLQQIFDRGMSEIPAENWFDFSLQATIAKASFQR